MKLIKQILYLSFAAVLFASCKKDVTSPIPISYDTDATAKLKVIYASAYLIRDSVQIRVNDQRVSNTFLSLSSTFLPTPYPGGGLNTGGSSFPYYLSVQPGNTKLYVSVPKKASTVDSILRYSGNISLDAGKYYSAYITDTLLTGRTVLVEENMSDVAYGFSRFRFVNLVPNLAAIDLYFEGDLVAPNVAYGAYSPEFTLAYKAAGQWRIRPAGAAATSTPFATYPGTVTAPSTFSVPNKRAMAVFAKGYNGQTAARTPTISLLYTK
jgi:hypothetical protein